MSYREFVIQGVSGGFLIHDSFPQLFFAEEESLDQNDNTNPDQDESANHHPVDIRRPDELYSDCDPAEKDQAANALPYLTAEDQRRAAGETQGDHDSGPPPASDD